MNRFKRNLQKNLRLSNLKKPIRIGELQEVIPSADHEHREE